MTKSELEVFVEEFFQNCHQLQKLKTKDYTGKIENPFAAIEAVNSLGISPEIGLLTRMMDKMGRISSFVENQTLLVKDESVTDTLRDLANYAALFAAYLNYKKNEAEQ